MKPDTPAGARIPILEIRELRPEQWDSVALEAEGFMQSAFWASFKARTGWTSFLCSAGFHAAGQRAASGERFVLLVRRLRFGIAFGYVPHAPSAVPEGMDPARFLEDVSAEIKETLPIKLAFIRYDLAWEKEEEASRALAGSIDGKKGRLRWGMPVQVPDTVILDLRPGEDEIAAGMKPKWRYNTRLAEKKGVSVEREGEESLPLFYSLYETTAKRDGIGIHPASYYRKLFQTAGEYSRANPGSGLRLSLWVARHEGQPLAAIITLQSGKHATYLYGASSNLKRNLMPAYALQWQAMRAAKAEGCEDYDFFGIPPDASPDHPMAGLYQFKTGFGGRLAHRVGCVEYPCSTLGHLAFSAGERLRLFWFKKVKKMKARRERIAAKGRAADGQAERGN